MHTALQSSLKLTKVFLIFLFENSMSFHYSCMHVTRVEVGLDSKWFYWNKIFRIPLAMMKKLKIWSPIHYLETKFEIVEFMSFTWIQISSVINYVNCKVGRRSCHFTHNTKFVCWIHMVMCFLNNVQLFFIQVQFLFHNFNTHTKSFYENSLKI